MYKVMLQTSFRNWFALALITLTCDMSGNDYNSSEKGSKSVSFLGYYY